METGELKYENLINVLNEYGHTLVDIYKNKLSNDNVNASYTLSNSVRFLINNKDKQFEVSLGLADYWKYVENGRKAGKFPPISKISEWIKIKPILPNSYNGKLPTQQQLTYLISRKIAKNGIKPRPLLKDSIDEINDLYMAKIEEALSKDIKIEFDDMFRILRVQSGL